MTLKDNILRPTRQNMQMAYCKNKKWKCPISVFWWRTVTRPTIGCQGHLVVAKVVSRLSQVDVRLTWPDSNWVQTSSIPCLEKRTFMKQTYDLHFSILISWITIIYRVNLLGSNRLLTDKLTKRSTWRSWKQRWSVYWRVYFSIYFRN